MDWTQRLTALVKDDNDRGRIRSKLIVMDAEMRRMLFDDNDVAVQASLLALIEPAAAESHTIVETIKKVIQDAFADQYLKS